jgi:hypothetical protein
MARGDHRLYLSTPPSFTGKYLGGLGWRTTEYPPGASRHRWFDSRQLHNKTAGGRIAAPMWHMLAGQR